MGYKAYKNIVEEIVKVCKLYPHFCLTTWMDDEEVSVNDADDFLYSIKKYRQELELDNHVECDEQEIQDLMKDDHWDDLTKDYDYGKEE